MRNIPNTILEQSVEKDGGVLKTIITYGDNGEVKSTEYVFYPDIDMDEFFIKNYQEIIMESKKEYYEDGLLMSVTYYLGGKEFDQYFYDRDGNLESHIILYDYGIRESHSPLI